MFVRKICILKSGFCSLNLESLIKCLLNSVSGTEVGILFQNSCFLGKKRTHKNKFHLPCNQSSSAHRPIR